MNTKLDNLIIPIGTLIVLIISIGLIIAALLPVQQHNSNVAISAPAEIEQRAQTYITQEIYRYFTVDVITSWSNDYTPTIQSVRIDLERFISWGSLCDYIYDDENGHDCVIYADNPNMELFLNSVNHGLG